MLGAFLTTVFFSLSAIFANRSIAAVGSTRANLGRLLCATIMLGTWAHLFGDALNGAGRNWFLLSGLVGMGLGDLASFGALPRLGSRLTLLMTQCLAAPIAASVEWLWIGAKLTPAQLAASALILGGVALALMPGKKNPPRVTVTKLGFLFGALAAAGQGLGAVLSRKANATAALAGESHAGIAHGITAAYQRILGGLVITVAWFALVALWKRRAALAARKPETPAFSPRESQTAGSNPAPANPPLRAHGWIVINALCGAVIGVSCYQWALATTPSGVVLPIVACTPLVIVPFSYWLEGERPTQRSIIGGIVAVAGVIALSSTR